MKVIVTDKYYIKIDELNHTVKEVTGKVSKRNGKPLDKTIGHFQSLASAVMRIAKLDLVLNENSSPLCEYIHGMNINLKTLSNLIIQQINQGVPWEELEKADEKISEVMSSE